MSPADSFVFMEQLQISMVSW